MADDKQKYTQQICLFIPINELPANVQNEVVNRANLLKIRKGGFLFKQGDRDEFSYYVIEGEIELHANNQLHNTIAGGTDRARYAMAQLQPRQFSARASKASTVMQISRDYLDKLLVLHHKEQVAGDITDYDLAKAEVEVSEVHAEEEVDWMTRMLQSELFSRMPTANIHALFALLEPTEFKTGDIVIKQGDPGQDYFIIQEGRCQVLRAPPSGGKEIKLAELRSGDCFGEEALISDTTRNATVAMLTDGVLMRLSKDNFIELVRKPTLQSVSLERAQVLVAEGAQWLDVRFKNEYEQGALKNSINLPLSMLRMQADKLDRAKTYLVYCDTGGRSSTGAFLLAERGIKACYLDGGLVNNPAAVVEAAPAAAPKPAAAKPVAAAQPALAPKASPAQAAPKPSKAAPAAAEIDEELDPAVKASVLEAELARTDMRIKDAEKLKQHAQGKSQQAMQEEIERRLQVERAKIEAAKKEAEAEAKRLRQREEEKFKHMKDEAEKRLQDEKRKLEEVYSRNAEEMEKLQRMKQEAEEQMRRDRERLEQEAEDAKRQLEEAQRLKKQVEASKRAMEKEGERRRKEQDEMEHKIQQKAREKLEVERRKLAEQFARNNEELDQARKERAEADAARHAARDEAARIIAEYKAKHDEARAVEEARLKAERIKLEAEQKKIQETLREIEQARDEAEVAKKSAMAEVEQLRARKQDEEVTRSERARQSLKDEIRDAEAKLSRANQEIAQVRQAREQAEEAKKVNAEDLARRTALEEKVRQQLEADLDGFKQELAEQEKKFASITSQMDHMRRIKAKADAAKKATRQANENLLADVESQLGRGRK